MTPRTTRHGTTLLVALMVGLAGFAYGFVAMSRPSGAIDGLPAEPGFMFGVVGLVAALGDARLLLGRTLEGPKRIARHLWRMCFAMSIATASFFLGQPQLFSKPVRSSGVLAVPVLAVLAVMVYSLVRVRSSRQPSLSDPRAALR